MAHPELDRIRSLLQEAKRGEPTAADELCRHLEPELRRLAGRRMGARARRWGDSGDIVQQVLLEVLVEGDAIADSMDAEEVLRRLARRIDWRIQDLVRNRQREDGASALDSRTECDSPSVGIVTHEDSRRWLEELVASLPEPWASTVQLCGLDGLSFVEAGRKLGVSEDTVRKRYQKAQETLQRRVEARRRKDT